MDGEGEGEGVGMGDGGWWMRVCLWLCLWLAWVRMEDWVGSR